MKVSAELHPLARVPRAAHSSPSSSLSRRLITVELPAAGRPRTGTAGSGPACAWATGPPAPPVGVTAKSLSSLSSSLGSLRCLGLALGGAAFGAAALRFAVAALGALGDGSRAALSVRASGGRWRSWAVAACAAEVYRHRVAHVLFAGPDGCGGRAVACHSHASGCCTARSPAERLATLAAEGHHGVALQGQACATRMDAGVRSRVAARLGRTCR